MNVAGFSRRSRSTRNGSGPPTVIKARSTIPAPLQNLVVPLIARDGSLVGVWDVDSPDIGRFDEDDAKGMEALCRVFMESGWEKDVG